LIEPAVEPRPTICPNCGEQISGDDQFCGRCGKKIPPAVPLCPKCGAEFQTGNKFCGECGQNLPGSQPETKEMQVLLLALGRYFS
jgi:predicted amidophosphoribosyltransferase